MTILQAAVLGAIQGLTEFLPVSSSGHLVVFPVLFGWEPQGMTFDVAVHLATLLAIIVAMRRELGSLWKGVRSGTAADRALVAKLLVGTIPAVAVGLFLGDMLDSVRSVTVVAWMLILWGIALGIVDRFAKKKSTDRRVHDVSWRQAIVIGVIQAFALIPGTSRSGATITAGLAMGLERAQAARYAFLLAIPAIAAAGAKTAFDVTKTGLDVSVAPMVVGFVSALVFGIIAIRFLLAILKRGGFLGFAIYRIALGLGILLFLADHAVTAL